VDLKSVIRVIETELEEEAKRQLRMAEASGKSTKTNN
jgi:hypothetical protein